MGRLGQGWAVGQLVVPAVMVEPGPHRRGPQAGHDGQLFFQSIEALAQRREGDAVGRVLCVEPTGPEAQLHPAAAHGVDLRHSDGQRARQPEGRRGQQSAQPDAVGLPGDAGQGDPRVGRPGKPVTGHGQEMVAPEEGVEPELLRALGHGQLLIVGGALLWFEEDA